MLKTQNSSTGGDLLARTLVQAGVSKVFAVHGGHLEAFYKGCLDNDIELIDFRHESSAGHAAEAYARLTGKVGVCVVTSGPGFTNAISAMSNAHLDCIPTLFIVGAPPLREAETNVLQGGIDQVAICTPTVKWAHRITKGERIPDITAAALRQAQTGRRGAVMLEVPIDVLHIPVPESFAWAPTGLNFAGGSAAAEEDIAQAISMLQAADRPLLICGVEAGFGNCTDAVTRLAERAGIPVFANTRGAGVIPAEHPFNGQLVTYIPFIEGARPDLVLLLGARLGFRLGGRSGSIVPHGAKLIQVFSDTREIGLIRDVDLPIAADSGTVAKQLMRAAEQADWPDRADWCQSAVAACSTLDRRYPNVQEAGGIHPYHGAKAAIEAAGKNPIVVLDGGESASWGGYHARADTPGSVIGLGYLGCLGTGPGQAIGAQIAAPARRVVQITGDGAMGFHIAEFDIMVRRKLPIMTVILNNEVWGMSIHGQQIMYGEQYHAISKLGGTNFSAIATAFGCYGERVTRYEDIASACDRAWNSGLPSCIEIMIDPDVVHPVTTAAVGVVQEGKSEILIPYYENVPLANI
jgi:acetolactate synthase I/II/III large subunit